MRQITLDELKKGCKAFWRNESRDAMYRVAIRMVEIGWDNPGDVADGLGVILLTWNNAAYRYGSFDFADLEQFLRRNQQVLASFRGRQIETFHAEIDTATVKSLFAEALDALAYPSEKRKTPVGVAKALHTLAPAFFPLWDREIARKCQCNWFAPEQAPEKYVTFMASMQEAIASLEAEFAKGGARAGLPEASNLAASLSQHAGRPKTMLKFLDEYLYANYTKDWI